MSESLDSAANGARRVYDVGDVCRLLGLPSEQAGYRVMRERQVPGVTTVGRRRKRVVAAIFDRWLAIGCPPVEDFERQWRELHP